MNNIQSKVIAMKRLVIPLLEVVEVIGLTSIKGHSKMSECYGRTKKI